MRRCPGFATLTLLRVIARVGCEGLRLRTAARALGQRRLDLLDRFGLGDPLHRRDFARQSIECRFIQLALGIRLFRLGFRAVKIANHLGDRDDVAGIDLGFVFLRPPRPHRALDPRAAFEGFKGALDHRGLGQLAHTDRCYFRSRHPQRHFVFDEIDDEQFEPRAGDLLLLNGHNLADAVRRVDDEFVGLEALSLRGLLRIHSQSCCSFRLRLAPMRGLRHADPATGERTR